MTKTLSDRDPTIPFHIHIPGHSYQPHVSPHHSFVSRPNSVTPLYVIASYLPVQPGRLDWELQLHVYYTLCSEPLMESMLGTETLDLLLTQLETPQSRYMSE
jgi:hypothetical protein